MPELIAFRAKIQPLLPMLVVGILLARSASAQFPEIELGWVRPTAVVAGGQVEMVVGGGNHLDQVGKLIFSDPRITAEVVTKPGEGENAAPVPQWGTFKVTVPADVPPGRYEVFAAGAYGVSNPRIVTVSKFPVVTAPAVGKSKDQATQPEPPPAAGAPWIFENRATAAAIDHFRITPIADRPRRVTLFAQRIDSRMIGLIKLYDSRGKLLQSVRGADGFDPSLLVPASADSHFVVSVQDFLFRGGDPFFYQLRADAEDARTNQVAGPPNRIETGDLSWVAAGAEGVTANPVAVAGAARSSQVPWFDGLETVTIGSAMEGAPSPIPLSLSETPDAAVVVTPPCFVASQFAKPKLGQSLGQVAFQFDAKSGQKLQIEVISQRLGQAVDPSLTIQKREVAADGKESWSDVTAANESALLGDFAMRLRVKDPIVIFAAPADGTYRIRLRNLDTGSMIASQPMYVISIREPQPDYQLVALFPFPHNDAANTRPRGAQVMRGDTRTVRVLAYRKAGFEGPIEVTAEGLPEGVVCKPVVIAANQNEAQLTITASDQAAGWNGSLKISGKAGEMVRVANPATVTWGRGDSRDIVTARLSTSLPLAVADKVTSPVSIKLGGDQPIVIKPGTNVTVPVTLTRRDGGGNPVVLRARNLPPGVAVAEVTIPADKSEGAIEFKVAADAKLGRYNPWMLAETKVKFKAVTAADAAEMTVFIPTNAANLDLAEMP